MTKELKRSMYVYENIHQSPELSAYLREVNLWHGYIKYLGLPQLNDHKDTPIQNLFVLPRLSNVWISPDKDVDTWPARKSVLDVLNEHDFLVVLGEPGGGKSTLVNWLTWRLAGGKYSKEIGTLIPFPMILRDLELSDINGWEELLGSFMAHPMAQSLKGVSKLVADLLSDGKILILIDGIDEVSDLAVRQRLRDAVQEGRLRYPKVKWILTSRIVGYEELPFESDVKKGAGPKGAIVVGDNGDVSDFTLPKSGYSSDVFYVSPFDNAQINEFCNNWYALRERTKFEAQGKAKDLFEALQEDRSTLRLARTPNLLTMMALLHRVKARLPHGRTLLYEDISHAYLHTIDDYRRLLVGGDYPLQHKKRWLAKVAWELQCKRAETSEGAKNILASREDLLRWFSESMAESGVADPNKSALNFLDYIAKRSGLLIPRSENMFAFLHLSFQEYFSSIYILDQFEAQIFGSVSKVKSADLGRWVANPIWAEVIVFLFELGSLKAPHWSSWLMERGFGKDFKKAYSYRSKSKNFTIFDVLFKVLSNPHSGLSSDDRISGLEPLMDIYFKGYPYIDRDWVKVLVKEYSGFCSEEKINYMFWSRYKDSGLSWIDLQGDDLEFISKFGSLDSVRTVYSGGDTSEVNVVKVFPRVSQLFILGENSIQDVAALNELAELRAVGVLKAGTIKDLSLSIRSKLFALIIKLGLKDKPSVVELESILDLSVQGEMKDLSFIKAPNLLQVTFSGCVISGFKGLDSFSSLKEIRFLSAKFKGVSDVDIPKNIKKIRGDSEIILGFSSDEWVIKDLGHGMSSAVRKKKNGSI